MTVYIHQTVHLYSERVRTEDLMISEVSSRSSPRGYGRVIVSW
jgi:hypothetical protein